MTAPAKRFEGVAWIDRDSAVRSRLAAREIADRYASAISAYWRGEPGGLDFDQWLAGFWSPTRSPQPNRPADAISPHGGGGRGLHWYAAAHGVVGHVPGVAGGYWIPVQAIRSLGARGPALVQAAGAASESVAA